MPSLVTRGFGNRRLVTRGYGAAGPTLAGVRYNVYRGDADDGPVDYSVAARVDSVSGTTYTVGAVTVPGIHRFAVRAMQDAAPWLEERNTDAVVRVVLSAAGADLTGRPGPLSHLSARPLSGGRIEVTWAYTRTPGLEAPAGFRAWATAGGSVNYAASPAATVAHRGATAYRVILAGPFAGSNYAVGARAYNATGDDGNTLAAPVAMDTSAPDAADDLTATLLNS